jgi:hypothetical protein
MNFEFCQTVHLCAGCYPSFVKRKMPIFLGKMALWNRKMPIFLRKNAL